MNSDFLKNLKKSLDDKDLGIKSKNLDDFSDKMKQILSKADNIKGDASSRIKERIMKSGGTKKEFTTEEIQKINLEEKKRLSELKEREKALLTLANIEEIKKDIKKLEIEKEKYILKKNNDIQQKIDIMNNLIISFNKEYGDIDEFILQSQ